MRVLFYTYQTAFQNPGGGETVLLKTKEHLEKRGVTVDLFDQWTTKLRNYELVHSFTWYTSAMWPLFREHGCRLVVTPVSWFSATRRHLVWAKLKARARDVLHGPGAWYDDKNYGIPDIFLPNSEGEATLLAHRFGVAAARMRLVPHGVDARFVNADASLFHREFGLKEFVLCVGRFVETHKNQIGLIRALRGAIDVPLVFIGSPGARDRDYYDRCRREAGDGVVFIDALPHDAPLLASAYKAAEVLVVPSFLEAPGLVALEAGLAGTKIVITERGATREYFEDYVDYVDPYSAESIRHGVRSALARAADGRLQDHILEHYTWDHVAEATFEAYRTLR